VDLLCRFWALQKAETVICFLRSGSQETSLTKHASRSTTLKLHFARNAKDHQRSNHPGTTQAQINAGWEGLAPAQDAEPSTLSGGKLERGQATLSNLRLSDLTYFSED